jgi:hypothetical protein
MGLLDFKNRLQQVKKDLLDKPKEVLLGQKAKVLNQESEEQDNLIEFDPELSFNSSGKKSLRRYYQALKYDSLRNNKPPFVYGMDCNACCVMYFLQNFGLIPPNISRKQFEYVFTVLNPPKAVKPLSSTDLKDPAYNPNPSPKSDEGIKINNDFFKPIDFDIFAVAFPNGSEGFLRGSSGAIFPHLSNSHRMLFNIMKAFYDLSFKKGYEALQKYHNPILREFFSQSEILIKNLYQELSEGAFSEDYFKQGFAIFVAVDYHGHSVGHYSVVTAPKTATLKVNNIDYHFYPADDPLNGGIYVVAPNTTNQNTILKLKEAYNKITMIISDNCAIGI